jgi:hypothetical protein
MRELTYFPLPESYPKTSGYGYRYDPITGQPGAFHRGVDYGVPAGVPLLAPYDGQVTTGYESGGAGHWSWVVDGGDMFKSFHHSSPIIQGGWVTAGTEIAWIDSTGSSTGSHAHLELWEWGVNIDPTGYLDRAPLVGGSPKPPLEDEMTDDDFNRIATMMGGILDNRIDQFLTPNQLWMDGDMAFLVVVEGSEIKRKVLKEGELVPLRMGSVLSEQPTVDVDEMDAKYRDAVRAWPVC